jgi:hypothetical protein
MSVCHFIMIEAFCIRLFNIGHLHFVIFSTGFEDRLDLGYRNYREVFCKEEEAGKEQSECTEVETDLPDGRTVISTPA